MERCMRNPKTMKNKMSREELKRDIKERGYTILAFIGIIVWSALMAHYFPISGK
jgi:hypothetical protein